MSKHRARFDSESESMDDASEPSKRSLEEIIAEYGDSEQRSDIDIESLSKLYKSKKQSSKLIQSFMDYGSIICLPRNPKCSHCIISNF